MTLSWFIRSYITSRNYYKNIPHKRHNGIILREKENSPARLILLIINPFEGFITITTIKVSRPASMRIEQFIYVK